LKTIVTFIALNILVGCASTQKIERQIANTTFVEIPEIAEIEDHQIIPPHLYEKYDGLQLAKSVIGRIRERELKPNCQSFDYRNNSIIQMRFSAAHIASLPTSGFLNVHQIRNQSIQKQENARQRDLVESSLARVRFENLPYVYQPDKESNFLRPKYAYMGFRQDFGYNKSSDFFDYGNVVAVFKDEVKDRATFSVTDSLAHWASQGVVHNYSFDYCETAELRRTGPYWETQIFGPLTLDDVEYFMVNCPHTERLVNKNQISQLKGLKNNFGKSLEVFACASRDGSHMVKGSRL
jgi:hypothetical protein